jgi:fermentation-respiration switch protein FrsA (DUF1100 family)
MKFAKLKTLSKRSCLRLVVFTILVILIAYLILNTGLALMFILALTSPPCNPSPDPIDQVLPPQENWLTTYDGHKLRFWYYPPQNGAAIIALGGMGGSLGRQLPPVDFLIEAGYGVLQIDSRACAMPPTTVTLGYSETFDAATGIAFLSEQPEVDRIGIMGFSMGGATAIRTAARSPEVMAVIAEGGYYNLGANFLKPDSPESLPSKIFLYTLVAAYRMRTGIDPYIVSPIDDLPLISPRPVLLIYGEHEVAAGRGDLQYDAALQPKTLWIIPGGSHGRNYQVSPQEYQSRILNFFNQSLSSPELIE